MKWLGSLRGHRFQVRYKAVPVDGQQVSRMRRRPNCELGKLRWKLVRILDEEK